MMFLYRQQCVCYVSNDDVRVLRLNQSPQTELVMSIPLVLEKTVIPKHGRMAGKFSLLHINEGILSCFYHYPSPKSGGNLLVIDTNRRSILLSSDLAESKDIWTRHSGDYIYCGVLVASTFLKRLEWILYTYDLKTGAFIDSHYWLQKLCGSKVNSEVCFEIIAGYFYGVSVLPALPQPGGAADISWHYWCVRFPIDREPDRQHVEEAPIFRRLQSHGPVDHRWTKLAIVADEVTGTPTIIETRKEWVDGGSDCPRTMYKTKIDFSQDFDPCLKVIRGSMVRFAASPNTVDGPGGIY